MCGDHRRPQTLAEMCKNMGICYGFRSVAARVKISGVHVIGPLGTNFSEILIGAFPNPEIKALSLIQLNTSSGRRNM